VRGRIAVGEIAIPSAGDYTAVTHNHCSNRNLSDFQRALRCAQSFFHEEFIGMIADSRLVAAQDGLKSSPQDLAPIVSRV
jgi:hypothetical protein